MASQVLPILCDFVFPNTIQNFKQADLVKLFTKFMASAKCIEAKTSTKEEANRILQQVNEKINHYHVKEKYIANRSASILNKNYFKENNNGQLVLPDLFKNIYQSPNGAKLNERFNYFNNEVSKALDVFYPEQIDQPDEIIFVTSTGYGSPNPVQQLISNRNWSTDIINCYGNDCYASVPAIKMAAASMNNPISKVKNEVHVIHAELCSLQVDLLNDTPQNIVIMSLFGDGIIQYKIKNEATEGFQILTSKEFIIPNSSDQMGWLFGTHSIEMNLSSFVPAFIGEHIYAFVEQLGAQANIAVQELVKNAHWAIHPGGPKIVKFVQQQFNLSDEQTAESLAVLKDFGNMSSATLPHIWHRQLNDKNIKSGNIVISLAFGPGLTACGLIMKKL